jgi:hypothetical protein
MNTITIKAQGGTMILAADERPSADDMTDIIDSLTRNDDNGAEFQALCNASTAFGDETTSEFIASCEAWIAGYRSKVPLAK